MKRIDVSKIASWLFIYYFTCTIVVAIILLVFGPESQALSLSDSTGVWAIIVPVFMGQIIILYQWFIKEAQKEKNEAATLGMPKWLVYMPPVVVIMLVLGVFMMRAMAVSEDYSVDFSEDSLKIGLTVSMSLLNATSIALNSAIFKEK